MKEILKQILIKILYKESELILKKHKPKVVAVTGTVGKTGTKDAIYSVLREFEYVRRSPKSFNSEIGIPLTILDVKNPGDDILGWVKVLLEGLLIAFFPSHYPKWLVLEVGTDKPGDIEEITKWLKPDVVVVTKLADVPVHVEAFGSKELLFEEKGKLVQALKTGGTLILNADDERVVAFEELTNE
ncbi:MAG: Mur ligase family protein, partial [Minisyncoccota bacterium]